MSPIKSFERIALPVTLAVLASWFLNLAAATPFHARSAVVKRQNELLDEYDFIVVGAGTAGLTVADRLTESGDYTVLVVEYGYLDSSDDITRTGPGSSIVGINTSSYSSATRFYNISSQPMTALGDRRMGVACGCVVGGSSAVNGMVFDRGSAEDYDAWVWAAGEEHQDEYGKEWGWDNFLPSFRKSVTFHPPTDEMVEQYQMTYDMDAWGGDTPIHASYPPFQWPAQQIVWDALRTMPGVDFPKEHADGHAAGVVWVPNSIEPVNRTRSYARIGHYDDNDVSARKNFHLLPAHRVTHLLMDEVEGSESRGWAAGGVRIAPRDSPGNETLGNGLMSVQAKREIILSAGAVHTPQVLQRSGLGPGDVLEAAGVEVKVELPGVGANLQDHFNYGVSFRWNKEPEPNQDTLNSNETYAEEANLLWQNNRTGPLAAYVSSMALLPLPVVTNSSDDIVSEMLAQDPAEFLPQGTHPTVIAGYAQQLRALARQFRSDASAVLEMPFTGRAGFSLIHLKPLSRGRIDISPSDDGDGRGDAEPRVDWRPLTNPVDARIAAEFLRWVRTFVASDAMVEGLDPVETRPGAAVDSDEEAIVRWLSGVSSPSNGHLVGTASMGPLELGGVVGPDLTVHGTQKLSIADNSIISLIPGTHTSATAYAIGEKAADLILRRAVAGDSTDY